MAEEMSAAARDVLAERRRQVVVEGWTQEYDDDRHQHGELGRAAALYALPYGAEVGGEQLLRQDDYIGLRMALELSLRWNLKPEPDKRKRLVKACALIIAEIERLDRLARERADA